MKVGDLVKYKNLHGRVIDGTLVSKGWTGIVVETGKFAGNNDLLVLWSHGTETEASPSLQIVTDLCCKTCKP